MKHSIIVALSFLTGIHLTACHSATKENKTDSAVVITATIPDFAYIADDKYVILTIDADSNWAASAPVLVKADAGLYCSSAAAIKADKIPAQYRSLLNQQIRVCNRNGASYLTTITGFKIYYTVIPHFGQWQEWNDSSADKKKMAIDISAETSACLVAEFAPKDSGALFALPATQAAPAFLTINNKAEAFEKEIGPELYKSVKYKATQLSYDSTAEVKGTPFWTSEDATRTWTSFSMGNTVQYVIVNDIGGNPCGNEFYAEVFSIWKTQPALKMIWMGDGSYTVLAAVDIDNDGVPEIIADKGLGQTVVLKQVGKEWIETHDWKIPYHDCPC